MNASERPPARLIDYLRILRPAQWSKHVLLLPGLALAGLLHPRPWTELGPSALLGFLAAAAIASACYALNEWLDARFDAHHPTKSLRPGVQRRLDPTVVIIEVLLLGAAGLFVASHVSELFFATAVVFLAGGVLYNVPPFRAKERAVIDVLVEALNSPLRLTWGWAVVEESRLPPGSLLLAFWMGGAFLMAVKRLAEYRHILEGAGAERLARYRRSFAAYNEESLLLSSFTYALMASFCLGVFLVKYRTEYLLTVPLFVTLFARWLKVGLDPASAAQAPTRLFRVRSIAVILALLAAAIAVLTVVEVPVLHRLSEPHYLRLPRLR